MPDIYDCRWSEEKKAQTVQEPRELGMILAQNVDNFLSICSNLPFIYAANSWKTIAGSRYTYIMLPPIATIEVNHDRIRETSRSTVRKRTLG
jgi:hypothetical protein